MSGIEVNPSHTNTQGGHDDYSQRFNAGSVNHAPLPSPLAQAKTAQAYLWVAGAVVLVAAIYIIHKHGRA